jgi:glycosyltransferase involved in cell wall biosynthesis
MPVHNAADFLVQTIASVQAQSLPDWELLAADDGSSDGSAAILARLAAEDPRIRPLSTGGNLGAGGARNCAMEAARGRYLAFLDADDMWHPEKLRLQIAAMVAAGSPFSCTAYRRHDLASGRQTLVGVPARASRRDLLKTNTVACSSAVIDRVYFGPRRMKPLRRRQDFLFWLELLTAAPEVLGLRQVLMTYRQHGRSLSAPKTRAARDTWTMYRQSLRLPLPAALWYFGNYAARGLLRHRAPGLARTLGWLHPADETMP